jgi:hypothetical protein
MAGCFVRKELGKNFEEAKTKEKREDAQDSQFVGRD